MDSDTEPMNAQELADMEDMRNWVKEQADASRHAYESVEDKLALLQTLVDKHSGKNPDPAPLQCMGISFGDALSQYLGLQWVMVEDDYGRDPALTMPGTTLLLFPKTMISKRVENGEKLDVSQLFRTISWQTLEKLRSQAH